MLPVCRAVWRIALSLVVPMLFTVGYASAAGLSGTTLSPTFAAQSAATLTVTTTYSPGTSGASSVSGAYYADGNYYTSVGLTNTSGTTWSGSLVLPNNNTAKFVKWTVALTAYDINGTTYNATSSASTQAFDSTPPTISGITLTPTTLTSAGGDVSISATVVDTGGSQMNYVVADLKVGGGPSYTSLSNGGSGNVYSGGIHVPANSTPGDISYTPTVTAYDNAGNHSCASGAALTVPAATVTLSGVSITIGGSTVTSFPAAGSSVQINATSTSPLGTPSIYYRLIVGSYEMRGGWLTNTTGSTYAATTSVLANTTVQTKPWLLVLDATVGSVHKTQTLTYSQPATGFTFSSAAIKLGSTTITTIAAAGGSVSITANVTNPGGIDWVNANIYLNGPYYTTVDMTNTSGSTYVGTVALPGNNTPAQRNWTVIVTASRNQVRSYYTLTLTQSPNSASVSTLTLSPTSMGAVGGNLTITAVAAFAAAGSGYVNAELDRNGLYYTAVGLTNTTGNIYASTVAIPANSDAANATWTVTAYAYVNDAAAATKSTTFTQLAPTATGYRPTLSSPTVTAASNPSGSPVTFLPAGDTANVSVTATSTGGVDSVTVATYLNGVHYMDVSLIRSGGAYSGNGAYTGAVPIPANTSSTTLNWLFVFVANDSSNGLAYTTATVGPDTQAYAAPTLTTVSVNPTSIPASGGTVNFSATAAGSGGVSGVYVMAYGGTSNPDTRLITTGGQYSGNGNYIGSFTAPANLTGAPFTWTFVFRTSDNGNDTVTSSSATADQAYAAPTITSPGVTPSPFAAAGSTATATYTVATSDGNASYNEVYVLANGVPSGLFGNLKRSGGQTSGSGTYTGTHAIPANLTGTAISYSFMFETSDMNGWAYTDQIVGPINQPYTAPTLTGSLSPSSLSNSGGTITASATATGSDIQWVYAWLYQDGTASGAGTGLTMLRSGGQSSGPGTYTGTVSIPANTTGVAHQYTVVAQTYDGATYAATTLGPVLQGAGLTSISPATARSMTAFTLTVNGSGFTSSSKVYWNQQALATTYVSATQLTAAVTTAENGLLATYPNSAEIIVLASDGSHGPPASITLTTPIPTVTSISPTSIPAGGSALTLTVNGANYVSGARVYWNGGALTTTFVNATQLTATVPAASIATEGTATVTVKQADGTASGSSATFTVTSAVPTVTTISPTSTPAGSATFTLTVNGSSFLSGASVLWNGGALTTTYVSGTKLTASVPAANVASSGVATITVRQPNLTLSTTSATFTIASPIPVVTSISPANTPAMGASFVLTVSGSLFQSGAKVLWNASALTTTFVSSTQLTATVPAANIASIGTATITVKQADGSTSTTSATFTITNPVPVLTALTPTSTTVGTASLTLSATGTGFVSGASSIQFGSLTLPATKSGSYWTATVPGTALTTAGTVQVSLVNAAPGGGTSSSLTFIVNNVVPRVTSITPTLATAGTAFTVKIAGTGFLSTSTVTVGALAPTPTLNGDGTISVTIPATLAGGSYLVSVTNPLPGGGRSNQVTLQVNNPVPTIASMAPTSMTVGTATRITVTGTGYYPSSMIKIGTASLPTTLNGDGTMSATVPTMFGTGSYSITVYTPQPGGGTSNAVSLSVVNPVPTITSFYGSSPTAPATGYVIKVIGTGYVPGSQILFGGIALPATYSGGLWTAPVPDAAMAKPGTVQVALFNPAPGGGTSSSLPFPINYPVPNPTAISPTSSPLGVAFSLTVTGTGFYSTSVVKVGGTAQPTTFSPVTGDLTVAIPATLLAGSYALTVTNPTPGGGTGGTAGNLKVQITFPIPSITSISPYAVVKGGGSFLLTVNGSNYRSNSTIRWNGVAMTTTYVSASKLTTTVPATSIATVGTASITVTQYDGTLSPTPATLTILNTAVAATSLTFSPTSVIHGGSSTGTVTLNQAAPAGGTAVTIIFGPFVVATVTVASGQTSATFPIATASAALAGTYTFTASTGTSSVTGTLTVQ